MIITPSIADLERMIRDDIWKQMTGRAVTHDYPLGISFTCQIPGIVQEFTIKGTVSGCHKRLSARLKRKVIKKIKLKSL